MTREEQEQKILENVPRVFAAGRNSMSNIVANALKGSAMGEAVVLEGVSPIEHSLGVKVSSKNLLEFAPAVSEAVTNGITYRNNGNGSYYIKGTATGDTALYIFKAQDKQLYLKAGNYTISGALTNLVGMYVYNADWSYMKGSKESAVITIPKDDYYGVYFHVLNGVTVDATMYPQLEKGTVKTAFTPYVADVSAVKLRVQGGNLTPYPYDFTEKNVSGTTFKVNEDGSVEVKGTPSSNTSVGLFGYIDATLLRGKQVAISLTDKNLYYYVHIKFDDGTYQYNLLNSREKTKLTGIVPSNAVGIQIGVGVTLEFDGSAKTIYPQLWLGDSVGEYEPYIEPIEYSIGDDIRSICPTTTITTDTVGVLIEVEYNKDINEAFEKLQNAIISLGGNL